MLGDLEGAMVDFMTCVSHHPTNLEALKRSGQILSAAGNHMQALENMNKAIELSCPDYDFTKEGEEGEEESKRSQLFDSDVLDLMMQRGVSLHKAGDHSRALKDLVRVNNSLDSSSSSSSLINSQIPSDKNSNFREQQRVQMKGMVLNYLGMIRAQLGDIQESEAYYNQAIQFNPVSSQEPLLHLGQLLKDVCENDRAIRTFDKLISAIKRSTRMTSNNSNDPQQQAQQQQQGGTSITQALYLKGVTLYADGRPEEAKSVLKKAWRSVTEIELAMNKGMVTQIGMYWALSNQALGLFEEALTIYDKVLEKDPNAICWLNREVSIQFWKHLDTSCSTYHFENVVNPFLKEGWCKRFKPSQISHYSTILPTGVSPPSSLQLPPDMCDQLHPSLDSSILRIACMIGPNIQLQCKGFSANKVSKYCSMIC